MEEGAAYTIYYWGFIIFLVILGLGFIASLINGDAKKLGEAYKGKHGGKKSTATGDAMSSFITVASSAAEVLYTNAGRRHNSTREGKSIFEVIAEKEIKNSMHERSFKPLRGDLVGEAEKRELDTFFFANELLSPAAGEVIYDIPPGIGPAMARYLYNGRRYDDKVFYVLVIHLISMGLIKFHRTPLRGCYSIETLKDSEAFYVLPPFERQAAFVFLGGRFNAGRLYTFDGINDFITPTHHFLQEKLATYSRRLGVYAPAYVQGFKKYLDVAERLRLPMATPDNEALLFVSKNLNYLAYALAFNLDNLWVKATGVELSYALFEEMEGRYDRDILRNWIDGTR
ncbi:hypothetical protein Dip510_001109 [Elusimicrobium posterum]|uniref:hypothetical protein n=1 Tax=Elusimicrobium posterum TaxID=3116653 RepID=UPI003C77EB3E